MLPLSILRKALAFLSLAKPARALMYGSTFVPNKSAEAAFASAAGSVSVSSVIVRVLVDGTIPENEVVLESDGPLPARAVKNERSLTWPR